VFHDARQQIKIIRENCVASCEKLMTCQLLLTSVIIVKELTSSKIMPTKEKWKEIIGEDVLRITSMPVFSVNYCLLK